MVLVFVAPLLLSAGGVRAQDAAVAAEVEASYRAALAAWAAADVDAITSGGGSAAGFGFRSLAPRGVDDPEAPYARALLQAFFASFEYYNLELEEIHTAVYDHAVVSWGFHTEDFKHRGREPERYRVRFSMTLLREDDGRLRGVLSHRDIQPFGDEGRYVPRH
jgi:hypothetical protein